MFDSGVSLSVSYKCQWVYRAFEDVEEDRGSFRACPAENGSETEEENARNGTGTVVYTTSLWVRMCGFVSVHLSDNRCVLKRPVFCVSSRL